MGRLLVIALLLAESAPVLVVRVAPPISLADLGTGCAPVLLTAEIRGPEVEEWYCPEVSWMWPDGTTSSTTSDCPPFDARHQCMEPQEGCGGWHRDASGVVVDDPPCPCTIIGYPRRWSRWVCLPPHPALGAWEIGVRLSKNGRTIARQSAQAHVR